MTLQVSVGAHVTFRGHLRVIGGQLKDSQSPAMGHVTFRGQLEVSQGLYDFQG